MVNWELISENHIRRFLIGVIALMISGCVVSPSSTNPLIDKVIRTADQTEISETDIYQSIASADVVYLGEIHDNPWHHELQLDVVRHLTETGARPAVGFEFFNIGQTGDLMTFASPNTHENNSDQFSAKAEQQLRRRLGWGKHRDDEWAAYFPIIDYARQNKLSIFGADLPTGIRRRITRVGVANLSPIEQRLIVDTGFRNNAYRTLMENTFVKSHCGWNDPELLDHLYQTWLARNDSMATAITDMLEFTSDRPIVMIVGSGHTTYNMGIYERVASLMPSAHQINIAFKPVQNSSAVLTDYLQTEEIESTVFSHIHEYLWFTHAIERDDPCEKFKHHLKTPPTVSGE